MQKSNYKGPLLVEICGNKSLSTDWPDPEELLAREYNNGLFNLPSDPIKARGKVEQWLKDALQELFRDSERYNSLRECGHEALSEYDINICHRGDAARALGEALKLKTNHITYAKTRIQAYQKYLAGETEGVEIQLGLGF